MLSACGGGGGSSADQPAPLVAVAAPAPAAPASTSPAPAATSPLDIAGIVSPVSEPGPYAPPLSADAAGGEAPYPDLRQLPTRAMPFESVVYGDVASVAVTAVR